MEVYPLPVKVTGMGAKQVKPKPQEHGQKDAATPWPRAATHGKHEWAGYNCFEALSFSRTPVMSQSFVLSKLILALSVYALQAWFHC